MRALSTLRPRFFNSLAFRLILSDFFFEVSRYTLVFRKLEKVGLLLLTDVDLPSVAGLVVGEPVRGSWWGHPRGEEIFNVSEKLADHPDVTSVKLVKNKVTFVHRRLWPALVAVGTSRASWQLDRLSRAAVSLLERVEREGPVRSDGAYGPRGGSQKLGPLVRELEYRLLLHSESVHTESGAHAKSPESWKQWSARVGLGRMATSTKGGQKELESAARALCARSRGGPQVPWVLQND